MDRLAPQARVTARLCLVFAVTAVTTLAALAGNAASAASPNDWPQAGKPVRVVVPFSAGSGSDACCA